MTEVGIPGLYSGHENYEDCITTTRDRCSSEGDLPITVSRKHTNNDIGTLHWDNCGNQTSGAFSSPLFSSLAGLANFLIGHQATYQSLVQLSQAV